LKLKYDEPPSNFAFKFNLRRYNSVAIAFEFVAFVDVPDIRLYNMLLSVCAAACDSRSGFAAFVLMCNAGVAPDESAYNTLISACAKSGDVDKAFETFRRMEVDGIAPSVITFGALMDSLSRRVIDVHYNAEETEALLERCFTLRADMVQRGVAPDAVVLNALVIACGRAAVMRPLRADALEKAFGVYDEMEHADCKLVRPT
jgi:pentatricopeptide repeat protein